VKAVYTELINEEIHDEKRKLKVFSKDSIFLATKKIGRNNPMEDVIKKNNEAVQKWNWNASYAATIMSEDHVKEVALADDRIILILLSALGHCVRDILAHTQLKIDTPINKAVVHRADEVTDLHTLHMQIVDGRREKNLDDLHIQVLPILLFDL
jgi:hypothetical protein